MRLSLVLPAYNEAGNIGKTVAAVQDFFSKNHIDGEIVVVNDGSSDETEAVLDTLQEQYANLLVISHETNSGYGATVRDGCDAATGDYIGFMDSDGQFDPHDFARLLPLLHEVPFVTGRRRHRADPLPRLINAKLFGLLNALVLGIWVRDINCAMKVFRKDVWQQCRPTVSSGALFNAELFANLKQHRIPWKQVDVGHFPRTAGTQTGANIGVILRMFRELWTLKKR